MDSAMRDARLVLQALENILYKTGGERTYTFAMNLTLELEELILQEEDWERLRPAAYDLATAARHFVAKVDSGQAQSTESYAAFKAALALIEEE
jgi:hypothetical protein